jgi:uncharacterized protein YbbC (DUF1343 family)
MKRHFQPGIETLLQHHSGWLRGRRIGLISHPAAVDQNGVSSLQRLKGDASLNVTALFGLEHGFFGVATAGQHLADSRHPIWNIPVFSLYGETRRPTPEMMAAVDVILFDIQDIGTRCYTFVSSLYYLLQMAEKHGKTLIVADRPVPLSDLPDGPVTREGFESFVAALPLPMLYGMTPAETATWMVRHFKLDVDLHIAPMQFAGGKFDPATPPWIPPSPGIASWESATIYPATVCFEAFTGIDYGRRAGLPFQLVGAPWMRGRDVAARLADAQLPGVLFHPYIYPLANDTATPQLIEGIRMVATAPRVFRPIAAGVHLLAVLQELYGPERLWDAPGARPEFFDKLFGTDTVRKALQDGMDPDEICAGWTGDLHAFSAERQACLLYKRP